MRPGLRNLLVPVLFVVIAGAVACVDATTDSSSTDRDASSGEVSTTIEAIASDPRPAYGTCPAAAFPDLSGTSPGAEYEAPEVTVTCSDTEVTVRSNDMVSYPFEQTTPNPLVAQDFTWTIPLAPVRAASTTSIVNRLGTLGFSITGIAIYGPTEAAIPAAQAFGDPVANGLLDYCGGHTGGQSEYHYHTIIYTNATCNLQSSQIVGYALDGFPIYNSVICLDGACTITTLAQSGYTQIGDPTSYVWNAYAYTGGADDAILDECNGRVEADGTYAYHLTPTQFPYIIGCFAGTPTVQTGAAAAPMPPMNRPGPGINRGAR